jgi:hypothetical protein
MVDSDINTSLDPVEGVETTEEGAEPDFDTLTGVVTDGFIGAIGGLVGTAAMTVVLLVGATVGAFRMNAFAVIAEITGTAFLLPADASAIGYVMFLIGGMVVWPLMLASIGNYLPGKRFAEKGAGFGVVLWTGFAPAFHADQSGLLLGVYLLVTLVGHIIYGFALGSVYDYLSSRPSTLV